MIYLYFILIILLLIIMIFCCLYLMTPLFSKVPYIPVRKKVVNDIVASLKLSDDSILYDLGCGDGRILFAVAEMYPNVSCIGIEKAPFPLLAAKFKSLFSKTKNVKIIGGNMFKTNVSNATHIFLFLFPELMDALLPKFEKELKPGTRVISCNFEFSNKKPIEVLDLKSKSNQLNRKLYIYNF